MRPPDTRPIASNQKATSLAASGSASPASQEAAKKTHTAPVIRWKTLATSSDVEWSARWSSRSYSP
jgi:hypothetical protein